MVSRHQLVARPPEEEQQEAVEVEVVDAPFQASARLGADLKGPLVQVYQNREHAWSWDCLATNARQG